MPKASARGYAPPISLKDLVAVVGIVLFGRMVGALDGAVALEPKGQEQWRYALDGAVVIGYKASATVTGEHTPILCQVETKIRTAFNNVLLDESEACCTAIDAVMPFVARCIATPMDEESLNICLADLMEKWWQLSDIGRAYALTRMEQIIIHPQNKVWYVQIVRSLLCAYRSGRYDEAIDWVESASDEHEDQPEPMPSHIIHRHKITLTHSA